ncbi:hypothetical protein APHAL10511_007374 [Amanita phalloides]|nr:hypothetical protein APHAL10511_007374 [Amanita phalloides]
MRFLNFALLLLFPLIANSRPTNPISFISIPLSKVHLRDTSHQHPAIVHQQNINNALRRYARMTGRSEPTRDELLKKLIDRMSAIPPSSLQKRYYREGINKIWDHLGLSGQGLSPALGSAKPAEDIAKPLANPHSGTSGKTGSHSVAPASVGIEIQGQDVGYMATIAIGTPSRNFRLIVDSGSADLWVGAVGCQADSGGSCGDHVYLGQNTSTSLAVLNQTWSIQYGTGSVSGNMVKDTIRIGNLQLPSHEFGTASIESSDFTSSFIPFDGLLGLAKSQLLSRQQVPTLVEALYAAHLIPQLVTSYRIPRWVDHKDDGEVTFGGMDPTKFVARTLVTVKNQSKLGFAEVALDAIHVNGADLGWRNRTLILDTGTTLIIAPPKDTAAIHAAIPGAKNIGGTWTVPCNFTTPISFKIGGREFTIDHRDIAFIPFEQNDPNGACMSGISPGNAGLVDTEWLVGDVFLKNVYFSNNVEKEEISLAIPAS